MIVTSKNPLDDLKVLRNVEMVVARGNVIDHPKVKRNSYVDENLDPYLE